MTEEDIIKMICAGGAEMNKGVRALYDSTAQQFLRFFVQKGVATDEAKEVLQETLVKIVRNAPSFSGAGSGKSWMWQIARSCMVDNHRKFSTIDSHESVKAAKENIARLAMEKARLGEVADMEDGVKVTRFPYVGDITKRGEDIVNSRTESVAISEEHWQQLEEVTADPNASVCVDAGSVDECVTAGLDVFSQREPERALVLLLQMDGHSIEEIGLRIDRTIAATKEYLSQCKKKIQPYIAHCTDLLPT
jgi:DNA-directed RNA polymerase specialized sigma24 family protein